MQKEQDFQVVMLPTEDGKEGAIWKFDAGTSLIASQGSLISDIPFKEFHLYFIPKMYKNRLEPNEVIKAGDWFIANGCIIRKCERIDNESTASIIDTTGGYHYKDVCHKIIASTNKEITPNAIIPKSYVDFYVDKANDSGVPFDYVTLLMESCEFEVERGFYAHRNIYEPKTNSNNEVIVDYFSDDIKTITITVKQAKGLYWLGREDKIASERNGAYIDNSEEWIKKHIK